MAGVMDRFGYRISQSARVAWYAGHYALVRRLAGPTTPPDEPKFKSRRPGPSRQEMTRAIRELFERDWRNIDEGIYALPHDLLPDPRRMLTNSGRFLRDAPRVNKRRLKRAYSEVNRGPRRSRYPRYYLQNFHYQTDGWLSEDSARLYDTQVEVLFSGTADAMRRQALVPLYDVLMGRDQRKMRLLDVASGTGRFLTFVKDNYPRLPVTALDLSPDYLAETRRNLKAWSDVETVEANAETMPLDDTSFDIVTCIYLFHELPPKVRKSVAREITRVLKPGGIFIFVDSLQFGDVEGWDGILEYFPVGFHEPYYNSYLGEDLPALFGAAGLEFQSAEPAFLSKVAVFRKRD